MSAVSLTLLSKPGCHLCDTARDAVTQVIAGLGAEASEVRVDELSILDDPALNSRYADEIPVVLINGHVHTIWRVEPALLAEALREATR